MQDDKTRAGKQKSQEQMLELLKTVPLLGVSFDIYKVGDKWEWPLSWVVRTRFYSTNFQKNFEQFLLPTKVEKTRNLWTFLSNVSNKYSVLVTFNTKSAV